MKKEFLYQKKIYIPAITIIALALVLTVIVGISSYRNLHRERHRVNDYMLREGRILLHTFEGRASSEIVLAIINREQWQKYIQRLLDDMVNEAYARYAIITDNNGKIIINSQQNKIGHVIFPSSALNGRPNHEDKEHIFEIAMPFKPLNDDLYVKALPNFKELATLKQIKNGFNGYWLLLGLDIQQFEYAHTNDLNHTIMMGAMLLIISFAAVYFIVVVQNYYLVNRTLGTMRTYTQNIVESMTNGLISVDHSGIITTINQTASQILGIDRLDAEKRHISEVFKSDRCSIDELLSSRKSVIEKEIACQNSSGYVPLSISISPLKDERGKIIGAVIILRDLREIKELQERIYRNERLASLGRLAAGVAHEIRNPLSSIRGFAQYFQDKFSPQTNDRKYSTAMVNEVDRLNRIIEALLDLARPMEPNLLSYSIEDVLNHAIQLVQADLDMKKVEIVKHIQDNIPDILMDRDQMIQVILNILLNGMDAIDDGGKITISISVKSNNIEIAISDTGSGIPQENLSKIFDPFYTTKKSGTGLGLSIVHRIIEENHRGEIHVDSKVGEGTTFTIYLPVMKGEKENA
ncbi:MAG: two-component system, NtrC family, sensor histidine kinase HydH [Candidatus Poribacteria bacterium]|nr:two-component system, NtrC family, sensor histidine kinase HydH [Candidatus Poribacteria bacterium]